MGFGGVLAQYAGDGGAELDHALRNLAGTVLGFVLVVVFALWLMHRSRRTNGDRVPVPDWYPDPWQGPYERWWNGESWTGHVRQAPSYGAWYGHPAPSAPMARPPEAAPPLAAAPSDEEIPPRP